MPTLLLVDDEECTRDAVARMLRKLGLDVVTLSSGKEALEVLPSIGFDLVILDWMMPEMDGMDVLRRIREDPATRGVAVMMYTAADGPGLRVEAERLGAKAWVLKSGGILPLYQSIDTHLSAGVG